MKFLGLLIMFFSVCGTVQAETKVCYPVDTTTIEVFNRVEGTIKFELEISGNTAVLIREQDGKCLVGTKRGDSFLVDRTPSDKCSGRDQLLPRSRFESFNLTLNDGLAVWERFGEGRSDLRLYSFECRKPYNQ